MRRLHAAADQPLPRRHNPSPRRLQAAAAPAHGCRPAASEWPQGRDGGAGAAAKVAASQLWSGEELVDHGGGGSAADRGGTPAVLQIYLDIVRRR